MAKQAAISNQTSKTSKKTNSNQAVFLEKNAFKIVIILAVIACVIRLYRLGFLSLWVDEYMHAIAAIKGQFKHGENNGILLTWFNTIFAFIFGHNEFAMRLPVALLGAALVPAIYVLGRDIANKKVGLMAAILVTVSLYLIFWSRVDRPYGMVATFYIPLLVSFWCMLEKKSEKENFLSKMGINGKYLPYVLIALVLSMMSQLICFLFVFSAGFYGSMVAIDNWLHKKSSPMKLDIYNILFYLNVIAVVLLLTPAGNKMMRPIIEIFLPGNMASLILPNLDAAIASYGTATFAKSFDVYADVISADFKAIPILGSLGFLFALIKSRKTGYFLISTFVVPFLLMSFVFRDPCHAKYLSYIYPVFLISAAYSLYFIAFTLVPYISKSWNETNASYMRTCTIVFIGLTFAFMQRKEISKMLLTEAHGNVVDKRISEIHFVNWKQPCEFIKENRQPKDVIMATVQMAPRFYLEMDSVVWFRQMHLDGKTKKYVPNLPDGRKLSAYTYDQLVKTYQENPRGWLLADYYFDNALTDPRAKEFVEQNFTYHFDACNDGAVKVFSWDKAKPKAYNGAFVIELGKNVNQMGSQPFSININKASLPPNVNMYFLSQGIDSDNEAFVVINGEKQVAIKSNGKPSQIDGNMVTVSSSFFKEGVNQIQFFYNTEEENQDITKGFVIYNFDLR